MGLWDSLKDSFSQLFFKKTDPCEEYHKALLIDPSYEVNPLTALFDLLITVVFRPLGYVGEKVGSFFNNVLGKESSI